MNTRQLLLLYSLFCIWGAQVVASFKKLSTMCFVAGTLVHTSTGMVPIEQISTGDLVWSQDEFTQTASWKPVVETFITHPTELYHLGVDLDADGFDDECITGTGEHPFYLPERPEPGFYPLRELVVGDTLLLSSGYTAQVSSLNTQQKYCKQFY